MDWGGEIEWVEEILLSGERVESIPATYLLRHYR